MSFLVILANAGNHLSGLWVARGLVEDGFLPPDQVEGRLRRNDGFWGVMDAPFASSARSVPFLVILANAGNHLPGS